MGGNPTAAGVWRSESGRRSGASARWRLSVTAATRATERATRTKEELLHRTPRANTDTSGDTLLRRQRGCPALPPPSCTALPAGIFTPTLTWLQVESFRTSGPGLSSSPPPPLPCLSSVPPPTPLPVLPCPHVRPPHSPHTLILPRALPLPVSHPHPDPPPPPHVRLRLRCAFGYRCLRSPQA